MAEFTAGDVIVPVVPSARNFVNDLKKQVMPGAYKVGAEIGQEIGRGVRAGLGDPLAPLREETDRQKRQAAKDGDQIGGAFARTFKARLEAAFRSLPKAEIDADSSPADRVIAEVRARMDALSGRTVGIDIDAGEAIAQVQAIQRELASVDGENISVDLRVDIAAAQAELAAIEAEINALDGKTARARVDVDVSGAMSAVGVLAAALAGLAAIPVGASITAGLASLSGPLAAAGAGIGAIAAVAGPSLGRINEALKAQEQAKDAAKAAAASAARSGGAAKDPFAGLSPSAVAAAKAIKQAQDAYTAWQKSLEPDVLPVITGGINLLVKQLPKMTPLVKGVSGALAGLEKAAGKALGGKFWTDFFAQLSKEAPGAVTGLGKSLGNVVTGVAGIVKAFLPFSSTVVGGIEKATGAFSRWGQSLGKSQGFKDFIGYVQQNGPKVFEVVKNLATTAVNLLKGLSGPGAGALDVVVKVSQWLAGLSPETLKNFTLAVLGVVGAFKTWKTITTVVDGVRKAIETVRSIIGGAKAVWSGLSKAASLGAKGVKAAASGISSAVKGIGRGAAKAGTAVWTGIQAAARKAAAVAKTSASAISGAAKRAGSAAAKGASATWDGIRTAASKAGTAAKTAGSAIVSAGKKAASAAANLGKVVAQYGAIALKAAAARAGQLLYAAAQGVVKAATIAWTAAQWALDAALNANPIGLIVVAIAALVAGLIYAWNNSETFRNIVIGAWNAIKAAVVAAWENVIQPALQALWDFITNVLGPVFSWLWNDVIVPAWEGIKAAVTAAWTAVIQPVLQAAWNFIKTVLGPVFTWLWNNVIVPAWNGIKSAITTAWNSVIKPALQAVWNFIKNTLGPVFTWIWKTIIVPAWDGIKTAITSVWEKFLKPTFDKLHDVIFKTIPDAFKKGVDFIKTAWDKVKDVAKAPVKFIVDVVYNNGIVKVWNAVADFLKLPKLSPVAFAKGGIFPGYTPGKDVGLAAVSGGEAIMRPEWTRAVGEDYVHRMNAAARSGGVTGVARELGLVGDPGSLANAGAFASGGIVGDIGGILAKGIRIGAEKLLNPLLDAAVSAMGDSPWAQMLANIPKKMISGVIDFLGGKEDEQGGGPAVKFARAQIGKPYQWGATGPDAYDCSGLTMRAWQAAGVTDIPRTSQQQMAWVKPVTSPRPGDLGFPHPGHVWMYSGGGKIIEAPYTGANVREVAARAAQVTGRPPSLFARGGIVQRMAGGGVRPQIADSPTVIFGEGRGAEAYIPLDPSMRKRSTQILAQTAQQLGYEIVPAGAPGAAGFAQILAANGLAQAKATGGLVAPTLPGGPSSTVASAVKSTGSAITSTLSTTARNIVYVLGDTSTTVSSALTSTSSAVSSTLSATGTAVAGSLDASTTASTAAAAQVSTATTTLSDTISKQLTAIQDTLNKLVSAVQSAGAAASKAASGTSKTKTASKTSKPLSADLVDKVAGAVKSLTGQLLGGASGGLVAPVLSSDLIAPEAIGGKVSGSPAYTYTGTTFDSSLTSPTPAASNQELQGVGSAGGPLVSVGTMNVTPEQSPYAIAQDLQYLMGAQLRMR